MECALEDSAERVEMALEDRGAQEGGGPGSGPPESSPGPSIQGTPGTSFNGSFNSQRFHPLPAKVRYHSWLPKCSPFPQPPLSHTSPLHFVLTAHPLLPTTWYLVAQGLLPCSWSLEVSHQHLVSISGMRDTGLHGFPLH